MQPSSISPREAIPALPEPRAGGSRSVDVDHYSTEDRLAVVKLLDDDGYFQLKGSVADLANALEISEPSIYRYLRQVRGQN
ncbi:helix-turn-helix domain-containing protein [Corynebacterium sp. HMSC073D01]|uniref:helix-turn-helix domain-containing protein n=1 Tax=Corynebacterium sp. HMSC073D01 TaxID=1739536 RepID=UPI0008A1D764|nr:helix-turn-helix domain-containing protein [Corynebacterium sp. HMSC073D01]